jgi:hypothetical protein
MVCSWPRKVHLASPELASHRRAVWSLPAESSHRPSKLGDTSRTQSACPRIVFTQYPVVTSQTRNVLSRDADTSRFPEDGEPAAPLGTNRTAETEWSCPGSVRIFLYSSEGSQSLIVKSLEQDARSVPPLGPPKSTSRTPLVWPLTVRSSSPSSQSHIFIVVSSEPDASDEKTGWNATQVIGERWDWRVCRAGARGSQLVGSWFLRRSDVGVPESSSLWRLWLRCSSSRTCGHEPLCCACSVEGRYLLL